MDFSRIEDALSDSRRHLSTLDDALPETVRIESLFVASIVLLIVSHYECQVAEQFAERAEGSGDLHVANFVKHQTARRFRSPDIGKITDTLKQFGRDYRERFTGRVENTKAHASWDNIMRARHAIVHTRNAAGMTLRELEEAYRDTHEVLVTLRASLGLSEDTAD